MKKKYIIIGIVLIAYLVLMILIFGLGLFKNKTYIVLGENGKIKYENGYVDMGSNDTSLYHNQIYDVYDSNGHLGNYKIKFYQNKWYVFDKNDKYIKISTPIFAIKSNRKYTVPEYKIDELNSDDLQIINDVLKDNGITKYEGFSLNQKINLDFDGDSKNETLYFIANAYDDVKAKSKFSFVIYVDNSKISVLAKDIVDIYESYEGYNYSLGHIIDLKKNGKNEIFVEKTCFDNNCIDCYEVYQLKYGKYKKVKACD